MQHPQLWSGWETLSELERRELVAWWSNHEEYVAAAADLRFKLFAKRSVMRVRKQRERDRLRAREEARLHE